MFTSPMSGRDAHWSVSLLNSFIASSADIADAYLATIAPDDQLRQQSTQLGTADPIESGGAGIEAVVGQVFSGVSAQSAPPMNSA